MNDPPTYRIPHRSVVVHRSVTPRPRRPHRRAPSVVSIKSPAALVAVGVQSSDEKPPSWLAHVTIRFWLSAPVLDHPEAVYFAPSTTKNRSGVATTDSPSVGFEPE